MYCSFCNHISILWVPSQYAPSSCLSCRSFQFLVLIARSWYLQISLVFAILSHKINKWSLAKQSHDAIALGPKHLTTFDIVGPILGLIFLFCLSLQPFLEWLGYHILVEFFLFLCKIWTNWLSKSRSMCNSWRFMFQYCRIYSVINFNAPCRDSTKNELTTCICIHTLACICV